MAKIIKNAGNITVGDFIFQVATRPLFPGSEVEASDIVRDMVTSIELGPDEDTERRTINKKHVVKLEGKVQNSTDDIIFDEETAIILWNKHLETQNNLAKKLIVEAETQLAKVKEDLEVIKKIQIVAEVTAEEGSAHYTKKGQLKELNLK